MIQYSAYACLLSHAGTAHGWPPNLDAKAALEPENRPYYLYNVGRRQVLKARLENLLTYFTYSISNALTEGFNSKIQSLKHAARGFLHSLTSESGFYSLRKAQSSPLHPLNYPKNGFEKAGRLQLDCGRYGISVSSPILYKY
ncbi:MAG: transposase [Verrucomicrobia bacterium]|nr:transposase [Verrucomicrobiota bacterium]